MTRNQMTGALLDGDTASSIWKHLAQDVQLLASVPGCAMLAGREAPPRHTCLVHSSVFPYSAVGKLVGDGLRLAPDSRETKRADIAALPRRICLVCGRDWPAQSEE